MSENLERLGYPIDLWNKAKQEAKEILYSIARSRARIPYIVLFDQIESIHFDVGETGRISAFLDEISREEDAEGRGMLSALVTHKSGDMVPGPGFYELAQLLGRDTEDELSCWVAEFNRVHDYWAN